MERARSKTHIYSAPMADSQFFSEKGRAPYGPSGSMNNQTKWPKMPLYSNLYGNYIA